MNYLRLIKEKLMTHIVLIMGSLLTVLCFFMLIFALEVNSWWWVYYYFLLFYNVYSLEDYIDFKYSKKSYL